MTVLQGSSLFGKPHELTEKGETGSLVRYAGGKGVHGGSLGEKERGRETVERHRKLPLNSVERGRSYVPIEGEGGGTGKKRDPFTSGY